MMWQARVFHITPMINEASSIAAWLNQVAAEQVEIIHGANSFVCVLARSNRIIVWPDKEKQEDDKP